MLAEEHLALAQGGKLIGRGFDPLSVPSLRCWGEHRECCRSSIENSPRQAVSKHVPNPGNCCTVKIVPTGA